MVIVTTVVVSIMGGLAFRKRFRDSNVLFYLIITSLVIPSVLISLGVGQIFSQSGLEVPDFCFEGWTSRYGPPAIQGREDGDAATPPLLKLVRKASDAGAKVIVIGCFDDTGLDEARRIAACPVIGIGQAAYHMAALAGARFSVVTTLAVSVPVLEENVKAYGLGGNLARVRASDVPVLDLELDADAAAARVIDEISAAEREDGVQSVALGCTGMVDIAEQARSRTQIRLIDGVRAAAYIARFL